MRADGLVKGKATRILTLMLDAGEWLVLHVDCLVSTEIVHGSYKKKPGA
jgi:hypothetical protein